MTRQHKLLTLMTSRYLLGSSKRRLRVITAFGSWDPTSLNRPLEPYEQPLSSTLVQCVAILWHDYIYRHCYALSNNSSSSSFPVDSMMILKPSTAGRFLLPPFCSSFRLISWFHSPCDCSKLLRASSAAFNRTIFAQSHHHAYQSSNMSSFMITGAVPTMSQVWY